jgi:hypothetical protein
MSSNNNYRGRSSFHRSGGRGYRGRSKSNNRRGSNRNYGKSNKSSRCWARTSKTLLGMQVSLLGNYGY